MKVFCILSDERAWRSKSPAMHSAVLRSHGIDGVYVPFRVEPDRVEQAVKGLAALNIAGANVTVPYKEAVMPHLDAISEEASAIAAVNTITNVDGRLTGHNTDAAGFIDAILARKPQFTAGSAVIFGAGGAAKAVGYAVKTWGAEKVAIAARDVSKARSIADNIGAEAIDLQTAIQEWTEPKLVVNCTSVSTDAESPALAASIEAWAPAGCEMVVDINYGRQDTFWERLARRAGAEFMDGLPMLAHQAARSFRLWTGIDATASEFVQALEELR